jgi:hypothetical protein|tara:strand:+ start:43 stop:402 length:360 start_codon:yes stop_codon:yes gene_type:complete
MSINFGTGYDFGQNGSIFTDAATKVEPPNDRKILAIQFLSDTTFSELSPTNGVAGICVGEASDEEGAGSTATPNGTGAAGGQIIDTANVFPKGLTIFGRWDSFTIAADADGGVIAYLGY